MTVSHTASAKPHVVEWYTNWKNRGYLAPESIAKMPIVKERWRGLSEQLTRFKTEEFVKR
jgi:large subunit ribosomal protein L15